LFGRMERAQVLGLREEIGVVKVWNVPTRPAGRARSDREVRPIR